MRLFSSKSLMVAAILSVGAATTPMLSVPAYAQLVNLPSFAPLVKEVGPAVVTVLVSAQTQARGPSRGDLEDFQEFMERFRDFMPDMPDIPDFRGGPQRQGTGSGFIIEADGIIVTNNHVVEDASEITVVMEDGTRLEAELIGRDTSVDIAVLKVDAGRDLPTVNWGDSDEMEVGDWAIAIGNPLGLDGTVTAGIVSSLGRDINSGPYDSYIQVDAAINRGNSGGPLFDVHGKVIGVNTAIISPSGGNVGLGFAIPAGQAREIVEDLLDDGMVERGWIGVAIQLVNEDVAESLGLVGAGGALVAEVSPDSPAAEAGIQPGDVILSFANEQIETLRDLTTSVASWEVGAEAQIVVWRDGAEKTLGITPGLLETASVDRPAPQPAQPAIAETNVPELGLSIRTDEGEVVIAALTEGDTAAQNGLLSGDRIVSLNQTQVTGPEIIEQVIEDAKARDRENVLMLIERDGQRRFVTLAL